jgi:urease accessory protein
MKGRRAKYGGQDAGTEVGGVGHERVTVMMDSLAPVEPRGDPANRQRARAEVRGSFARVGSGTEPARLFETGGLRWRFPRSSSPCEAAILNTGGGVAGGDSYRVSLELGEAAEVEATTPSAERIYRSDGPAASIATRLVLASGARLFWLPQETLMFEGARLERRLEVEMSAEAALVIAETVAFGRLAMGERRIDASLRDSWRVRRDGRLIFADETRLNHAGAALERKAVGAGARGVSTIVAAAPNIEARLPDLRAALEAEKSSVEAGASAFDGLIVARLVSASPSRLRAALIASIVALGGRKPRLWA